MRVLCINPHGGLEIWTVMDHGAVVEASSPYHLDGKCELYFEDLFRPEQRDREVLEEWVD